MIIEVKKVIEYPDVNGTKKVLQVGRHTVPNESLQHWFVKGMIVEGSIVLLGDKAPEPKVLKYPDAPPERKIVNTITVNGVSGNPRNTLPQPAVVPVFDEKEIGTIKQYLDSDKKPAVKANPAPAPKVKVKTVEKNPVKAPLLKRRGR